MPQYTFKCNKCDFSYHVNMSISEFLEGKDKAKKCSKCKKGKLFQLLTPIYNSIERKAAEMKELIKEESRQIADKINSGDEKLFRDVCGETVNPLKRN